MRFFVSSLLAYFSALAHTQGINLLSKYDKLVLVVFLKTRNQEFRSNDG